MELVRAWAVDGGDFGFLEAQVDGELAAVMRKMAECSISDHRVTRSLGEDLISHFETPAGIEVRFARTLKGFSRALQTFFKLPKEFGAGRGRLCSEGRTGR